MNKKIRSISMIISSVLIATSANAGFVIKVPLEVPQGGSLPYNTIIIGNKTSEEPIFDIPDPLPTDDEVVCQYSMSNYPNIYVYASGLMKTPDNEWISYKEIYYNGQKVINAFKGQEMMSQNDETYNMGYFEICVKGEPMYSNQNNEVETQDWDQDDCRYNNENYGVAYSWTTVTTSDGRSAFSSAKLGSYGTVTANSSNITYPAGTITVPEGKIFPNGNQRIIMGNIAFDRGNYHDSDSIGTNMYQSRYEVCKKSAK